MWDWLTKFTANQDWEQSVLLKKKKPVKLHQKRFVEQQGEQGFSNTEKYFVVVKTRQRWVLGKNIS